MTVATKPTKADEVRLYLYDIADHGGTPTYTEVALMLDQDFNVDTDLVEFLQKGQQFKGNRKGKSAITFSLSGDLYEGDTERQTYLTNSVDATDANLGFAIAYGDITASGTRFHRFGVVVNKYSESGKAADSVKASVELALGDIKAYAPKLNQVVA